MIILGRERDFETLEFGLQFSLGGLVDEGKSAEILTAKGELFVANARLATLNEGSPSDRNNDFSSHS